MKRPLAGLSAEVARQALIVTGGKNNQQFL
jgi:hypothetical protein